MESKRSYWSVRDRFKLDERNRRHPVDMGTNRMIVITYGLGGYCQNCDETHDHPLHNIIEKIEIPDEGINNV